MAKILGGPCQKEYVDGVRPPPSTPNYTSVCHTFNSLLCRSNRRSDNRSNI